MKESVLDLNGARLLRKRKRRNQRKVVMIKKQWLLIKQLLDYLLILRQDNNKKNFIMIKIQMLIKTLNMKILFEILNLLATEDSHKLKAVEEELAKEHQDDKNKVKWILKVTKI